jgi:2-polyprenyl-3-methyl-5-hydroxy-6-metoxy-1,4-benzoquinol methylase
MIKNRGYQHNFSKIFPATMSDSQRREKKAKTMVAVLSDYLRSDLKPFSVLDIGSSTGIIANYLSKYFGKVVGIDIDKNAIAYAKNNFKKDNLQFAISDSMDIDYPDNSFDVIICAHVYEHVPDADRLMTAIHRVLKPGGVCYFSAGNRLTVKEPHYNLPFLSVMPRYFAHRYMKIVGKGTFYYEKHLSYWGLKRLIRNFERIDYTKRIIENLELFYADYMIKHGTMKFALARLIVNYAYWLCPSFIWLLRKKCDIPNKLL